MNAFKPAYMNLLPDGELKRRAALAMESLTRCRGCAWNCEVNRAAGELGQCCTGLLARVSSYSPHLGEEAPLSGWRGSGTIFFTRCNLRCCFCQNHDISQTDNGALMRPGELAEVMLRLQQMGCHNINLVSPSHVVPQILTALAIAAQEGLRLPLVYNSGGYDSLDTLQRLDGVVDIYMPDMKYAHEPTALRYSGAPDYPRVNQQAVREMHRQVGDLIIDQRGIAERGLLVRHLVLPNDFAGTRKVVEFLAHEISMNTYLNIMDQYYPAYQANQIPKLNRRVHPQEYQRALDIARRAGLTRLETG